MTEHKVKAPNKPKEEALYLDFRSLVKNIGKLHNELKQQAFHSVNTLLTLRNWIIGYYIAEYQLKGSDRAVYGKKLFEVLADELKKALIPRSDKRELYRFYEFYKVYPQIVDSLNPQFQSYLFKTDTRTLHRPENLRSNSVDKKVDSLSPQLQTDAKQLITRLSFTHL